MSMDDDGATYAEMKWNENIHHLWCNKIDFLVSVCAATAASVCTFFRLLFHWVAGYGPKQSNEDIQR